MPLLLLLRHLSRHPRHRLRIFSSSTTTTTTTTTTSSSSSLLLLPLSSSSSSSFLFFFACFFYVLLFVQPVAPQAIKSFESTTGEWAWVSGSGTRPAANYGFCDAGELPCDSAADLQPGGRLFSASWQAVTSATGSESLTPSVDLFVFGGLSQDEQLNNDLWRFNYSQWVWVGGQKSSQLNNPSTDKWPGDRLGSASWLPRTANPGGTGDAVYVLVFGGWGMARNFSGEFVALDEMWEFSTSRPTMSSATARQLNLSSSAPPARAFPAYWSLPHGTSVDVMTHWMFGGWNPNAGFNSGESFNDLWSFTFDPLQNDSTIQWTQHVAGSNSNDDDWPSARHAPAVWTTPSKDNSGLLTFLFGGSRYSNPNQANQPIIPLNDLWRLEMALSGGSALNGSSSWVITWTCLQALHSDTQYKPPPVHLHVPTTTHSPQGRAHAATWVLVDAANISEVPHPYFYMMGGAVQTEENVAGNYEARNDMWRLNITHDNTVVWQWVAGNLQSPVSGTYNVLSEFAASTYPGSRYGAAPFSLRKLTNNTHGSATAKNWTIGIFGGGGCGSTCADDEMVLNDVWEGRVTLKVQLLATWLWVLITCIALLAIIIPSTVYIRRKRRQLVRDRRSENEARARLSMHKFQDHLIDFEDLIFGARVGTGAAGTVYKAKLRRHTDVAVKSVSIPAWAAASITMEELLSEVQILRRIPHEHIVRLYGLALEWQEHAATDTASVVSRTSSVVSKATTTTIDSQDDLYHSTDALQRAMTDLKAVHIVMELCSFSLDEYMRMSAAYIPEQASDGSASVTPSSTASTRSIASTRSSVWSTPPPLDALQRARILQQVASAIAFMHSKNISHRDLKTGNILLAGPSDNFSVRICDFGLSKSWVPDGGNNLLFSTSNVGTPSNMAPELIVFETREGATIDPRELNGIGKVPKATPQNANNKKNTKAEEGGSLEKPLLEGKDLETGSAEVGVPTNDQSASTSSSTVVQEAKAAALGIDRTIYAKHMHLKIDPQKCDVYSFSIVMWSVAAWRRPFLGMNVLACLAHIVNGGRPRCDEFFESQQQREAAPAHRNSILVEPHHGSDEKSRMIWPEAYIDIMQQCWSQNAADRPSMATISDDLHSQFNQYFGERADRDLGEASL